MTYRPGDTIEFSDGERARLTQLSSCGRLVRVAGLCNWVNVLSVSPVPAGPSNIPDGNTIPE